MKTFLVAVCLLVGTSAWAQVTPYSNDYEDATPNVDWVSGNTGRYTVAVEGTTDHYLHVAAVSNGNNGTTITSTATNGKVTTGTDFYMSFDLILDGCSDGASRHSIFYIYDASNSASTPILKIYQNAGGNYTGWTINDNTALTTGGKGTGNWYNYVLTRIGSKEYLTVTKKTNSTKVLDMVEITSLSTNGGLGKMVFETNRYYAGLYFDNVVLRALDAPAFTLSTTSVTPEVSGNATVNVTGITGTVSVSSDDTSVATASYNNGEITINGVANGVANITVTAINDGAKTTQKITATVGSVAKTNITVNYLCGGSPIASATTLENVNVGSTLTLSDITYSETVAGVGCRYTNPSFSVAFPYTVEENGVIDIIYTQQNAVASLNVYANVNSTNHLIRTYDLDSKYVGDVVTVTYPEYYLEDGILYSTAQNAHGNGYYKWNYTLTGDNIEVTYGTTVASNVVSYVEAESISGGTASSSSNADIRCSDGKGAYFGSATDVVTLPAGKYHIYAQIWGNAGATFTFSDGTSNILTGETKGYLLTEDAEFTLTESKTITVTGGDGGKVLDFVYIVKTGEVATIPTSGYGTIASAYALDCANLPDGLKAYQVTELTKEAVTLEEVTEAVAANTGLILKGTAGETYNIPVAATGADISATNKLQAAVTATAVEANETYILQGGQFHKVTAASTIPAGKAYLRYADLSMARELTLTFGDATGIGATLKNKEIENKEVYNLKGQRVAQPTKGLYIQNGKKVIVK